ncbi:hypothetical protein ACFS2C_02270 [Prauserella oleivorans]|uniref:Secreted protein n=1 Tax=Prauserella oleivorans TaxID=1478153 RepID=A0ABW5W3Z7_9PSEU
MNTAAKLCAYGAVLALVAGGAWVLGGAVGPVGDAGAPAQERAAHGDPHGGTVAEAEHIEEPAGLASSRGGYTFTPTRTTFTPGTTETFTFRITGPDGHALTRFETEHEKRMHLIVVRRDTAEFQHLHPELRPDGTWAVPLTLGMPGTYRAFADFVPAGGEATTLGVDLAAPGEFRPASHEPSRVATVDGYTVRLDGDLVAGRSSKLTLTITRDGRPLTDLQPYLGADGHLVALRTGDLAYLHVHPGDDSAGGPAITFHAEVPSAGTYRLFLDFRHRDVVRTAGFTVEGHA